MKPLLASVAIVALFAPCFHASAAPEAGGVISQHPAVSPSGTEILFSADFDGSPRLWIARIDGSNLRKVSNSVERARSDSEPSWSPDGRHIVYSSRIGGGTSDIWVVDAGGAYPVRLTANGANNTSPTWSPDSSRIVFVSDKDGTKDIWAMNSNGSQQTKLLNSSAQENNPRYSPTGTQIVFSRTDGEVANLFVMNANGTGVRQLTTGNFQDWTPHWGSRGILFSSNRAGKSDRWMLWTIQPDGTRLASVGNVLGHDPNWLPDGRIVFTDEAIRSKAAAAVSVLNPSTGTTQVVADVQGYLTPVDIRPGKSPNQVNPRSAGKIWVAILSSATFDAPKMVDPSSLTFGRTGAEASFAFCKKNRIDVNADGIPDLVCRFSLRHAGFQSGDVLGILRFEDTRGVSYEGRDSVVTVAEDDRDDFKDD